MNQRILRTKRDIKQAFFTMRHELPIEKIHVEPLCRQAMINKTTFYRYYADIYDLVDQLQVEAAQKFGPLIQDVFVRNKTDYAQMVAEIEAAVPKIRDEYRYIYQNEDEIMDWVEKVILVVIDQEQLMPEGKVELVYMVGGVVAVVKKIKAGMIEPQMARQVIEDFLEFAHQYTNKQKIKNGIG